MADTRLTLRFNPKMRARLRKQAKLLGRSESEFVRLAVEKALGSDPSTPTSLDLLRKHTRFIGSAKGLPPDASTNEDYMEGFGEDPK